MSTFKFSCPHCGRHIQAEKSDIGRVTLCPACRGVLIVQPEKSQTKRRRNLILLLSILILLLIFSAAAVGYQVWGFQRRKKEAIDREERMTAQTFRKIRLQMEQQLDEERLKRDKLEKALAKERRKSKEKSPQTEILEDEFDEDGATDVQQGEADPLVVTTVKYSLPSFSKLVTLSNAIEFAKALEGRKTITFNIPEADSLHYSARIPEGISIDGKNLATGNPMEISGSFFLNSDAKISNFRIINPDANHHIRSIGLYIREKSRGENIIVGPFGKGCFFQANLEDVLIQKQGIVLAAQSLIHDLHIDHQGVFLYSAENQISGDVYIAGSIAAISREYWFNGIHCRIPGNESQLLSQTKITLDLYDWRPGEAMVHRSDYSEKSYDSFHEKDNCQHSVLIDNLAVFSGAEKYVIKIRKDQPSGTYLLAGNAADARGKFFLQIEGAPSEATLILGVQYFINGQRYLLQKQKNGILALTINGNTNQFLKQIRGTSSTVLQKLPSDGELRAPVKRNADGTITLSNDPLLLRTPLSPPFTINAVCALGGSGNNVRFEFCGGVLIFNWECNHRDLRLEIPGISSQKNGVADGSVPCNQWVTYKIRVTHKRIFIYVNGKLRHIARGNFKTSLVGIHTYFGGVLQIKEFFVNRNATR